MLDMESSTTTTSTLSGPVFDALPEFIQLYIRHLEARICELEARISKNSSNSGKPPSSDGLKRKPKSLRGKSGKKPGGQQGHAGKGLAQVEHPDVIISYEPANCTGCGSNLNAVEGVCAEKRQVFEIPKPKIEVTEHQAMKKVCPCCGEESKGSFPDDVRGHVQYGDRVRAL
jgi:transposase